MGQSSGGDVGELLDGLRPTLNIGVVKSAATHLPVLGVYDVVVMGGGTAGAPAGAGAARNGAKTLVIEYLHGMGGVGTQGMIGRYFYGYRHGFTNEVDKGVRALGGNNPRQKQRLDEWVFDWKTEWYRREIRKAGGEIWFGVIGIGAYVENKKVKGVVVSTPYGRGVVLAHTVIDSTGSADIAIAAGAGYSYTDGANVAVQGAGMPPKNPNDFYNNTDWTFTDKNPWGTHYNYDQPGFQDTIAWMRSLIEKGYMPSVESITGQSSADLFGAGKYAMITNGSWMINQMFGYKGIETGLAPTPAGPNGKRSSMYNGLADSIWVGSQHKAAAAKWVEFLGSAACQDIVGKSGVVFPAIPSGTDLAGQAFAAKNIDVNSSFLVHIKDGTTFLFPITDHASQVTGIMQPAVDAVFTEIGRAHV